MKMTPEACVARGAAWLDEAHPGWHRRIDLDTLDLSDGTKCICGQMFEPNSYWSTGYNLFRHTTLYAEASAWLYGSVPPPFDAGITDAAITAIRLGFNVESSRTIKEMENVFEALDDCWRDAIMLRLEEDANR